MTDAEKAVFDPIIAKGKKLSDDFAKLRSDDVRPAFAKDLSSSVGDPARHGAARTKAQRLHSLRWAHMRRTRRRIVTQTA